MALLAAKSTNNGNQMPLFNHWDANRGFSTESGSDDSCCTQSTNDDISDSKEDTSSEDDEDDWCTPEDTDVDSAQEKISMQAISTLLSAVTWPDDVAVKYRTFREEVLSHEVIFQRTWIRIKAECTRSVNVCTTIHSDCHVSSAHILPINVIIT